MIEKPIFVLPVDLGTIATGNERTEAPALHLNEHDSPGLVWRSNGSSSVWARGQMAASQVISYCSVLSANALPGTQIRLRLGASQAEVDGTAPYDSGTIDFISPPVTRESGLYHSLLRFTAVDATWWRIDITGHTDDFEAMSLILGKEVQSSRFYDRGFEESTDDLGSIDFARWGVAMEVDGFMFRTKSFKLSWVSEAEFNANFRSIMMQGKRGPVLLLFNPEEVAGRQEEFYFGRFAQPPFAQNSRKPGTFAMEFSMLSMLPASVSIPIIASGDTALSASTLTRTSGPTTYPPTVSFTRPLDWADGDKVLAQWSTDYLFGSGVSETPSPLPLDAEVSSYDFGLSAIVSGSYFIRIAAFSGTRPGSLTWSNLINVGDVVAPVLNDGTTSSAEQAVMAVSITSDEPAYLTLGGTDASLLEISPSSGLITSATVRLVGNANLDYEAKASYSFTITATDAAGNAVTETYTHNVTDADEIPSSFTWTDQPTASPSTQYTSNTITMAGLGSGIVGSMTFTQPVGTAGEYQKNGGSWTALGTVSYVNGDTFAVRGTTNASALLEILATSAGVSDTFNAGVAAVTWDAANKNSNLTLTNDDLTVTGVTDGGQMVAYATKDANPSTGSGTAELEVDALPGGGGSEIAFGLAYSSMGTTALAKAHADAVCVVFGSWGWEVKRGGSMVDNNYGQACGVGTVMGFVMTSGSIQFTRNSSNIGSATTCPSGTGNVKPFFNTTDASSGTADFGGW